MKLSPPVTVLLILAVGFITAGLTSSPHLSFTTASSKSLTIDIPITVYDALLARAKERHPLTVEQWLSEMAITAASTDASPTPSDIRK